MFTCDNILAARLKRLVEAGIFERGRYQRRPDRYEYLLTAKGRALGPVVAALRDWGASWTEGGDQTKIAHRPCGHPISARLYCPDCDRQVTGDEIGPIDQTCCGTRRARRSALGGPTDSCLAGAAR